MISITDKTLKDLEFHTVLEAVSASCTTEPGMEKALQIVPFKKQGNPDAGPRADI